MLVDRASICDMRQRLSADADVGLAVEEAVAEALAKSNGNAGANTYLWQNAEWTASEARRVAGLDDGDAAGDAPLKGVPISVKDCFDLVGAPTSCGTIFYRNLNGVAARDSWLVERLRVAGAVIVGKTHLHPLAYGITGENEDFGDCLQPGDAGALTGGSSSGAAASVMEGSAMAAIGTDTGGSVRAPAALCGLAGYRASLGRGDWRGGAHLAPSFDTMGWLFRDLEDGPLLGSMLGDSAVWDEAPAEGFAVVSDAFLADCEPEVVASLRRCQAELEALGLTATVVDVPWWSDSLDIFAPIQAVEAAEIHRGHFAEVNAAIRQRLEWGAGLGEHAVACLRARHEAFREQMDVLLAQHELLLMPAIPVTRLEAGADHSQTRTRLLRYTTPVSLAGMPAVTIPFSAHGWKAGGMQLVAARDDDARLLVLGARIGGARKAAAPVA